MRQRDHVDLEPEAHAGLLEALAHRAVEQADGREILHAGKAHRLQLGEELRHQHERVGAVDAGQHRRVLDHRQHLARHVLDDLVGVAIGEQPRRRAAAGHAVAAGIVDDDQVDAAGLLGLGGQAGAGAAADDRLAGRDHLAEFFEDLLARYGGHFSVSSFRRFHGRRRPRPRRTRVVDVQRQADQPAPAGLHAASPRWRRTARRRRRDRRRRRPRCRAPRRPFRGSGSAPDPRRR